MRYTDANGVIRIGAVLTRDEVRIDFMDSGPGVSAQQLPRLFERFYRGESSRNRASGWRRRRPGDLSQHRPRPRRQPQRRPFAPGRPVADLAPAPEPVNHDR